MHPGILHWWFSHKRGGDDCEARVGCGPGACGPRGVRRSEGLFAAGEETASPFGVRRPLRFLAHKLELDELQVAELAKILDALKTERAQADVDHRRSLSVFADAVAGAEFDAARAAEAATSRVTTAERLRKAVITALERLHAVLRPDQRERLAYLLRTGAVTI